MISELRSSCMHRYFVFIAALLISSPGSADEHLSAGTKTFAWAVQNVHFYDAPRFGRAPIKEMLEKEIVEELEKRNLRLVTSVEAADLELSYIAVLENEATHEEMEAFHQRNPDIAALHMDSEKFEQGVLFAKLVDRRTGQKVWESTQRGLVALSMPEVQRTKRLSEIIRDLVSTYSN